MKRTFANSGLLSLALLFSFFSRSYSIGDQTQVGAREVSLGSASVALISAFSVFHNQAALAMLKRVSVAVDYRQPYLIEGFAEKSLAAIIPNPLSNFAFTLQQKGIPGYTESGLGFAMAKSLGKRISAGLKFNYFLVDFPEQASSRNTFFMEFGMLFQTTDNATFGLHVFNPSHAKIESLNLRSELPFSIATGVAIKTSANLLFAGDIVYCIDNPINIRMGIEYEISGRFFLRGGLSGKPIRHSAGLGYRSQYFAIDFGMVHHESLGYTPSISLALIF